MTGITRMIRTADLPGAALATLVAGLLAMPGLPAVAQDVSYTKNIKPILENRCYKCHGAEKQKGDLRLDSKEAIMVEGEYGMVVTPGKPEESTLYTMVILPSDDPDVMPAKGDPVTPEEAELIKQWILAGAKFDDAAMKEEAKPAASGTDFATTVWPILQASCIDCHGPEKQKGDLRLDSPEAIMVEGEYGTVVTPGKPEESTLYTLTTLPADDVDIMPAKGDPLTTEQTDAIKAWITAGADFGGWTAESAAKAMADAGGEDGEKVDVLAKLAENTEPAPEAALAAVTDLGGLAMPLDMKTPLVRVDYHLIGDKITDEHLATLPPLAAQLTWLNLANTKITDAGLAHVAKLPKLTRLHLERTGTTDAGLAHLKGLEHLEYLNLYGTKVTDAGLAHLKGLKKLKKLFLWQTDTTEAGVKDLQAALPALLVDTGLKAADMPATEMAVVIPAAMFTADSCCAKAAAENKVCEHPCCEEARKNNTVCTKCNKEAEALLAMVAKFDEGSCCAKAYAGGKLCDHDCCKEAWAAKKACAKCNPKGAAEPKPEPKPEPKELAFDEGSCCAKAKAEGKACDHPCCVEAAKAGKVCAKCNPKSAAPEKVAKKYDEGSCCAKAQAEGRTCNHKCCREAEDDGKVCKDCNPNA